MITQEGGKLQLSGPMTLQTVKALFEHGLKAAPGAAVEIDLAQVEAVDSSAVSLLLAWLREARRNKLTLTFTHIPDNLTSLARLYGVAELLPDGSGSAA